VVHEYNGHSGRQGSYAWAHKHGLPPLEVYLVMAATDCPI
jgi:hypothetical protein